jgi:VIT1/CCC1 family predicted Fe2+/Mn2+ transporter
MLYHELGHFLNYVVDRKEYKALLAYELSTEESAIALSVSGVASDNGREFVAEVFAGLMAGKHYEDARILKLFKKLKGCAP